MQKVVDQRVWGDPGSVNIVFSRVGRLGPRRKRPSGVLAPGSGRKASKKNAKKKPSSLTLNLDQQPDKLKSTEKQKTDHLHWVTHRGGLGAAH